MGKKVRKETAKAAPAAKVEAEEPAEPDSLTVAFKKANDLVIKKQIKAMSAQVTEKVDLKQVVLAAKALKAYVKKQAESVAERALLTDEDQTISVSFTLTRVPTNPSPKPHMVKIDHPYLTEDQRSRVCVIVKDPARAFKDQIQSLNIPCIAKVIGYDKLKRNFKQFKDKRQLLKDYDAFLADLRVYKMLPELMGKEFYQRKKYPCPIKLHGLDSGKDLEKQLNAAAASTFFQLGNGPNYSVKVGKTFQKEKEIGQNTMQALG
mmetsp:Transcript_366/g.490  ORF Transcript_366/g.490 Transcript_366/m.490 type:complete len:263 (-) Transcript_366:174-962(-)